MKRHELTAGGVIMAFLLLVAPSSLWSAEGCREGPCHRLSGDGAFGHNPFVDGRCADCHEGNPSGHPERPGSEFALAFGGGSELCYSCHEGVRRKLERSLSVHRPVGEGRCLACHLPHAAPYAGLLSGPVERDVPPGMPVRRKFDREDFALCWDCHDAYMILLRSTRSRTAFRDDALNLHYAHVSGGEGGYACNTCHGAHSGRQEVLLGRDVAWKEDFVSFSRRPDGGACVPGCHGARAYSRGEGE